MPVTILERIAAGDPSALDECMDRYGGLIWSLVRRLAPDYTDAEDIVQEILVGLWRSAGRFDPRIASEATFITMIARRRLIDRQRRRGRELDTVSIGNESLSASGDAEARLERGEEVEKACKLLAALRPEERRVLELSLQQGLSQSQIAAATNLPLGTVKTHARRGLMRLRRLLKIEPTDNEE